MNTKYLISILYLWYSYYYY